MGAFGFDLLGQGDADFLCQSDVPGGAKGDADREGGGLNAADQRTAAARAVGTIGDAQLGDVQPFDGGERPEVLAREQAHLLFKGQGVHEGFNTAGH